MADPTTAQLKDCRRWKNELRLARKREQDWRRDAEKIVKRYRGEEKKRNRFNVLWANTEILRPAIYNSRPNPDVRRRFRDSDPIGKAVSAVLERSLDVICDLDDFDDSMSNDVLDGLLVGRGVSRVRYVPKITDAKPSSEDDGSDDDDGEGATGVSEPAEPQDDPGDAELVSESVEVVHVDWQDFAHGYGRTWAEVPCCFFRHKLTRPDAQAMFDAQDIKAVEFAVPTQGEEDKKSGQEVGETEKVAEFWECWDKNGDRVFFINDKVQHLLFPKDNADGSPPIDFDGFFPCPRPLAIIENTGSLLPIPPFHLYEEQANELDKISGRIDKIVNSMRLRGAYDARITEMADILSSDDNEMVPVQNAQQWSDAGLDKALSWIPVEKNVEILNALYDARTRQKQIIDELTGIADIIRGATDANETATAQQLKSNYSSVRLNRMQKAVQRYARDMLRLCAAAMSQKFSPQTFAQMTELNFPLAAQKAQAAQAFQQQLMAHAQAMAQPPAPGPIAPSGSPGSGAPSPGPAVAPPMAARPMPPPQPQPPPQPPALLSLPTWEDVIGVMRSDKRRQYKVDVETDSTVAGTLSSDMAGLSQVLQAIGQTMTELTPLVEQQVLPIDAAKEIVLTVIRRARMGMAVEDAFDKLQAPKPKPDPKAAQAQAEGQTDITIENIKQQGAQALQAAREQAETMRLQMQEQAKTQREQFMEQQKASREMIDAKFDAMVRIIVATIGATKQPDAAVQPEADRTVAGAVQ
jgi:hypothetical protein